MIPLSDENPTLRTPVVTYALLFTMAAVWIVVQGAGLNPVALATSVCNLGLIPGEITGEAPVGLAVPLAPGLACVVDRQAINFATPLFCMFLHGSWVHLLSNGLFLWVFGNNVEDSMGRLRFLLFYLICGLAASAAQVAVNPASPIPMVGASGAISGVMAAYLVLYPRAWVNMLFFIFIVPMRAWVVILWWFALQLLAARTMFSGIEREVSSGIAVMAHMGGFVTGLALVKPFENRKRVYERVQRARRVRSHPVWR